MDRHKEQTATKVCADDGKIDKTEYEARFKSIVNKGIISLQIAMGHRLGLLTALKAASDSPVTSKELATSKKLKERYVREWLGCMVAAEIAFLKVINEEYRYYIPNEMDFNMPASLSSFIPHAASKCDALYDCFQLDGPAGYGFSKQEGVLMTLDREKQNCKGKWLDDNLIPPFLEKDKVENILDIGCGTGRMTNNIAAHFHKAEVIGIDPVDFAIETAKNSEDTKKNPNVKYFSVGAESMTKEWDGLFDWVVVVEVLHDVPNPHECIEGIKRVLKKGGVMSVLDPFCHSDHKDNIGLEGAALALSLSCLICVPSSLSCQPAVGNGVGWGLENRAKFLEEHGFEIVGDKKFVSLIHCIEKN